MKNTINTIKKTIIAILALIIGLATIPFCSSIGNVNKLYAYTPVDVKIDNGDFSTTSGGSYPKTASSWTMVENSNSTSQIKAGVISTVLETYKKEYKNYGLSIENTSDLETRGNLAVYMINAQNMPKHYGIKSTNFELDANSYYLVSVDVKTDLPILVGEDVNSIESMASIYLNLGEDVSRFVGVQTQNAWTTYTFYVHTNKFNKVTANMELWLGTRSEYTSSGAVLFDNVVAQKLSSEYWAPITDATNTVKDLDNPSEYDANSKINNPSFEDTTAILDDDNWQIVENEMNDNTQIVTGITDIKYYNSELTRIAKNPLSNGKVGNDYALFINNEEKAGVAYKSKTFTIEQYTNYLIEVYVKTGSFNEGGASVSLVPTNEDLTATEFTGIKTTTTSTNSITNDWQVYSFYVQGSPFGDEDVYLQLGLGSDKKDDLVKGYVFFDDVNISRINFSQYSKATISSTVKQAKLHNTSSSSTIENAYFNVVDNGFTGKYPMQPSNWTASNKDNITSGIISTNVDDFNSKTNEFYGNLSWDFVGLTNLQGNVNASETTNNVLMIYNPTFDKQSFESASYSLATGGFYKVSFEARTATAGKGFAKVKIGGSPVATLEIKSEDKWANYEAYIASGFGAKDLTVELGLGSDKELAYGHVFFDNVIVETITAEKFDEIKEDKTNKVADYRQENFTVLTGESNEGLAVPSNWAINDNGENTIFGVEENEDGNYLTIIATNGNVKAEGKLAYTLSSEEYYIATFKFMTSDFENLVNSGVTFGFKEIEASSFKNIIKTDEFVEFKFYINGANYSTLTPFITLNVNEGTKAEAVKLASINFETITIKKFENKVEELENDESIEDIIILGQVTPEEESPEKPNYVGGEFDWYWIPVIITTLALFLAIFGVIIQKRKNKMKGKKARNKKVVNNYDREITLHKALVEREAEAIRKQKLDAIKEKLKLVDEELEAVEKDYQETLQNSNVNKEQEFKKYAKNRKKVANKKEKLEEEQKFIQSEEFFEKATNQVLATYEPEDHTQEIEEVSSESQEATENLVDSEQVNEETSSEDENNVEQENEQLEMDIDTKQEDK